MSDRHRLTIVLGVSQLLSWACTFYVPAVIAGAAAASLGASRMAVVGGFSWALLVAGVCAPRIGRQIDRAGGRPVLAASSLVLAAGLALLAAAHGLGLWYAGWTVLGLGMALGLYDAAFATLGRLLGPEAPPAITGVTLIAGFASSLGWSVGPLLVAHIGWRGTLLAYAAAQLAVNLPMMALLVPATPADGAAADRTAADGTTAREDRAAPAATDAAQGTAGAGMGGGRRRILALLSSYFTLRWFITSALAVYILPLLRDLGLTQGAAIAAAALIGPGQVAGRMLEWTIGPRISLFAKARMGAALMPLGVACLLFGGPAGATGFAVLYGMSNGILTINRGTLPLALFGPQGYASLLGWLAVPVLLAQASAPTLVAPLIGALPAGDVFLVAGVLGGVAGLLLLALRRPHGP
ncbi:MAG: MFS transporter [Rhodospirillales bacterium]|nr:MFS transporter [Rhodospirillales bacterium]